MTEEEKAIWRAACGLYAKYRGRIPQAEDFMTMSQDAGKACAQFKNSRLILKLVLAVIDYYEELYKQLATNN